ncbi:unnamed protein product [Protopolystoma xenopodis]|uniref:Uncharacterized protein n=1 Tax=Protopolystoma xenopodis TaxID=117903 RepID=A0A448XAD3_9PLAT|nr:unnamed protein product [Protopolystoma xenopodis]
MVSGSDDNRDMTRESSAQSHRAGRTMSRGLIRSVQPTKVQGKPAISVEANLRIPSTRLLKRNERYASNQHVLLLQ